MKRVLLVAALAVSLAFSSLGLVGCKVKVQTGTRYVCTYGEKLGSDIKDLEVKKADAGKYTVKTKTITCSRHRQAEEAYRTAQEALKKGDVKAAQAALGTVVKLDPKFRKAASQLDELAKGKKPPADSSDNASNGDGNEDNGSGDKPGGDKPPADKPAGEQPPNMDGYRDLVPDTLEGFTAEQILAEEVSLTRAYVPKDKSKYDQLVIMVQQFSSDGAAKRAMESNIKSAYNGSPSSATAAGLKTGYFGVNGSGFAVVSLVNGDSLVTLELHATDVKASSLKSELVRIAEIVLAT